MDKGVYYCGPVKKNHKGFFLVKLENLMKYWTGGSYIVMKSNPIFPGGIPPTEIGYK